jgi:hypothetical protein
VHRLNLFGALLWLLSPMSAMPQLPASTTDLERLFAHPPDSARPWVNWFWMDGNISREGITADLESMQRVGIGGVLLMDVSQEIPTGPVAFNSPEWRELFQHVIAEARRLGLEVSLNNAPGWSGSGGPWITADLAMQKVVWSRTNLPGPSHFEGELAPVQVEKGYFRPIAVLAFPALPGDSPDRPLGLLDRIPLHQAKAGLSRAAAAQPPLSNVPPSAVIAREQIRDLTSATDTEGRLRWDVPAGQWTVLRLGATLTGMENHPTRPGGAGLECDKLSREAIETHFNAFLGRLIDASGQNSGRSFAAIHVDSWEIGFQNWTPRFREEFRNRRGYDLFPYLPTFSGRIVQSADVSERFLWDIRRTIADLEADNYAGHLAELAHRRGMKLSIEGYANGPFDNLLYASRADLPMGEFWTEVEDYSRFHSCKSMASAAHVYGKPVVPAEAFTSYPATARWMNHPYSLKPLGDAAFCEGINRLVIHRYAHQPWLDRKPGMTFGRFGVHYERTQTWWEQSRPWHEYLARCQFLLQSGVFVADVCYLTEEVAYAEPPRRDQLLPPLPPGYEYDVATPEAVLTRMSVNDGRLALPDRMTYRLLVLPQTERMTPRLLEKIKRLVEAGATVLGPRPTKSPSLNQYPECDQVVKNLADELWADCDGQAIKEHRMGKGRVVSGKSISELLAEMNALPDFRQFIASPGFPLRWIHRTFGGTEIYFVANSNAQPVSAECAFRVTGKWPELWHPDSGRIEKCAVWRESDGQTIVPLALDPAGSCFVVFREPAAGFDPVSSFSRDRRPAAVGALVLGAEGKLRLLASEPGSYEIRTASAKVFKTEVKQVPRALEISGPWEVRFPPKLGAPESVVFPRLLSWSKHEQSGVKYFSGTATYQKTVVLPPEYCGPKHQLKLDLNRVQVIAEVSLNGRNLGVLWKPPFRVDITGHAKPGNNQLEIKVTNLWPNRLIGDEQLADDCEWGTRDPAYGAPLARWPEWLLAGKPSPTGRLTFATWKHWYKDSPLLESGLLGPVTVQVLEEIDLN